MKSERTVGCGWFVGAVLLACALPTGPAAAEPQTQRPPNIILFFTDDKY